MSDVALSHVERNSDCQTTILLIHGAFSSHREWTNVAGYLQDFHLLIPSLPSHGSSLSIRPFTLQSSADLLADLIRNHAKTGRAHVVGLSLGGIVALHLGAAHPELVKTVFASGISKFSPSMWTPILPYTVYGIHYLTACIPRRVSNYLIDAVSSPPGLREDGRASCTIALCRELISVLVSDKEIQPVEVRTLIIAATKRGLLPTNDNVETARLVGKVMRSPGSKTVEVKSMRHAWNLQEPPLFAQAIRAWINEEALPSEFVEL